MKLKLQWNAESIERGSDSTVGARLVQLTSRACVSYDIYCEERYTSADGSRFVFLRDMDGVGELWIYDLPTGRAAFIARHPVGYPSSNLFRDSLFYLCADPGPGRVLRRLDLKTLEQEQVFDFAPYPEPLYHLGTGTMSPDERYYVSMMCISDTRYGLSRADLSNGTCEAFHEHADMCNPHPQFEPVNGNDILIQLNRGCGFDETTKEFRVVGEEGATLYLIGRDSGNVRYLPVGKPHTGPVTGHECWVGNTGRIILTAAERDYNTILLVSADGSPARCLWKGLRFGHISASVDGKYFVVDDAVRWRLYIGNIATNRMLSLCDTGSSCGNDSATHPHAYMTPDNRWVIFNSDRTGISQVWGAEIPGGFLDALDAV